MTLLGIARRLLFGAAVFAPTLALAQPPGPFEYDPLAPRGRQGGPDGRPGDNRFRPPVPPIMAALDTNHDGELSAAEIRNASAALKSLDRNHDGILDRSELGPRGGAFGGPNGPPAGARRGGRFGGPPAGGPDGPPDGPGPGGRFGGPPAGGPDGPPDGPGRGGRFGGPPPDGPDGPPDGARDGGRFGGPPAGGPDGPPDGPPHGGPPPGAGRGRPEIGRVLPPLAREELGLSDRQHKQIAELENDVKRKLESILTADQVRQLRELMERGPGDPGGRRVRGGPPGAGPPDDEDGPPVRPQRPRR